MVALRVQTVFPHAWSVSLLRRTLAPHCVLCVCARADLPARTPQRSEEHTSELQSQSNLVCRLLLEKKKDRLDCDDAALAREVVRAARVIAAAAPAALGALQRVDGRAGGVDRQVTRAADRSVAVGAA